VILFYETLVLYNRIAVETTVKTVVICQLYECDTGPNLCKKYDVSCYLALCHGHGASRDREHGGQLRMVFTAVLNALSASISHAEALDSIDWLRYFGPRALPQS